MINWSDVRQYPVADYQIIFRQILALVQENTLKWNYDRNNLANTAVSQNNTYYTYNILDIIDDKVYVGTLANQEMCYNYLIPLNSSKTSPNDYYDGFLSFTEETVFNLVTANSSVEALILSGVNVRVRNGTQYSLTDNNYDDLWDSSTAAVNRIKNYIVTGDYENTSFRSAYVLPYNGESPRTPRGFPNNTSPRWVIRLAGTSTKHHRDNSLSEWIVDSPVPCEYVVDILGIFLNLRGQYINDEGVLRYLQISFSNNVNYLENVFTQIPNCSVINRSMPSSTALNIYDTFNTAVSLKTVETNPYQLRSLITWSIDQLKYYFNAFHIPFVIDDEDAAINTPIDELPDYHPIEPSQPNIDNDGDYNNYSDPVDFPPLPDLNITNTGFLSIYRPEMSTIKTIGNYLWSDDFLDNINKLFTDPAQTIISLSTIPLKPLASQIRNIKFGNLESTIPAPVVDEQLQVFDFGTLTLSNYFGTYADYSGYTDIQLYLPFIGLKSLEINDIMGSTIHLKYYIDIYSGDTIAYLKVYNSFINSILYSWQGNILTQLPFSSANYGEFFSKALTGGIATLLNPYSAIGNAINIGSSLSPQYRISDRYNNGGLMSLTRPYVIISRPLVKSIKSVFGFTDKSVGELKPGYNKIESVVSMTTNVGMLNSDYNEILSLLHSGVYN